jgi:hypothetical protein
MHEAAIENNSSPGQAVYEPFSGSGTTIIAAEITGQACHRGFESSRNSDAPNKAQDWEGYAERRRRVGGQLLAPSWAAQGRAAAAR